MIKLLVYGPSGHGKTASMRNLPAEKTGIINCDRKSLPFAGWKNKYVTNLGSDGKVDFSTSNYVVTDRAANVIKTLEEWEKRTDIEYIAIDTFTHILSASFMRRILEKGFDKFSEMAKEGHDVIDAVQRSTKKIVVFAHNDVAFDANGNKVNKLRGFGKLLDEKIQIESKFQYVMIPTVQRSNDEVQYMFQTQSDGTDLAKTPGYVQEDGSMKGLFDFFIPNDVKHIFDEIENYELNG